MSLRSAFALLSAALVATPLFAAEKHAFSPQAFEAAQTAGKPILVAIHAPWCPTCKAQEPILDRLGKDPKFGALQVFEVDFDSQKDALRKFHASAQSTLIVFKGKSETGRSVGDSNPASIAALLDKAL